MGGGVTSFGWEDLCESCKGYETASECFCPSPTSPERPSNKPHPGSYEALRGTAAGAGLPVDPVNHPPHYTQGGIETIDAIEAALTAEEFRGYCKGNALKYVWRERHKGQNESIKKAIWYLNRLVGE